MKSRAFSIRRLRALILLALVVGMSVFTAMMLKQVDRLSNRFGPQVRADLEWRAMRGAAELAKASDLGVAMSDRAMVEHAFAPYTASEDVLAIVAIDPQGAVIAQRGAFAPIQILFASRPGAVVEGPGYLASWQPVTIEGAEVGRVAIAVSTARLTDTRSTLGTVATITLASGGLILAAGIIVILFFTRAVVIRDAQLNEHATNLERRVEERTRELDERNREMRSVLDNVAQGFITIDANGAMATERSAIVDTWFGPSCGGTLSDLVRPDAPEFANWLDASLQMIRDDFMPLEVSLAQMPQSFVQKGRSFSVSYSPIMAGEKLERLLVIISDVTAQLGRERAEREQRELIAVFQHVGSDRAACEEFLDEAEPLVEQLLCDGARADHDRALHTLKGNAGMFGFDGFAALCHEIESELRETDDASISADQRTRLAAGWTHVVETLRSLLGEKGRDVVEIERSKIVAAITRAREGASGRDMGTWLLQWCDEPVHRRFERFAQQARSLAKRLGKDDLDIVIDDDGVRLDPDQWGPLWAALVHVVRNAVDHGVVAGEDGRPRPALTFTARRGHRDLTLAIADNGPGVDWERIRDKAARANLPCATRHDLVEAMFTDGVSTRDVVSATSGRGVGLSALRGIVHALGGSIDVISEPSRGTRFEMRFALARHTLTQVPRAS